MQKPGENVQLALYTRFCDNGGLLYLSAQLCGFGRTVEELFTACFSCSKLCADSVPDMIEVVRARLYREVCSALHNKTLTTDVMNSYVVQIYFFVKEPSFDSSQLREGVKHLKLRLTCKCSTRVKAGYVKARTFLWLSSKRCRSFNLRLYFNEVNEKLLNLSLYGKY